MDIELVTLRRIMVMTGDRLDLWKMIERMLIDSYRYGIEYNVVRRTRLIIFG